MAFSQSDLDNVNSAIASGALSVRKGDRMITYRSMIELKSAKAEIEAALASTAGAPLSAGRYRRATFPDD